MNNPIVPATSQSEFLLQAAVEVAQAVDPIVSSTPGVRLSFTIVTYQADRRRSGSVIVSANTWGKAIPSGEEVITAQEDAWIKSKKDIPAAIEAIERFCQSVRGDGEDE